MALKPSRIIFNAHSPPNKSPPQPQTYRNEKQKMKRAVEDAYQEGVKDALKETLKIRGKSAVEEANKELIKEGAKEKKKLSELYKHTRRVLFKASSVFPFDFFPDEITIEVGKVNIIRRIFFFSANIHSLAIKSIKDVAIETSLLFAALKIVPDGYPNNPLEIRFLKKGDAIKARNIIQGLLVADREDIEPAIIETDNLERELEEIGTIQEVKDV